MASLPTPELATASDLVEFLEDQHVAIRTLFDAALSPEKGIDSGVSLDCVACSRCTRLLKRWLCTRGHVESLRPDGRLRTHVWLKNWR